MLKRLITWAVLIVAAVFALKDPKAALVPVHALLGLVKSSAAGVADVANSLRPGGMHYHVTPAGGEVIAVLLAVLILAFAYKAITRAL